jgi:hypothetical protein
MCDLICMLERVPITFLQCDMPNTEMLPRLAEHAFLAAAREVVLSGFTLELYSANERPAAYWYAAKVMSADCEVLDALIPAVVDGKVFGLLVPNKLMACSSGLQRDELVFQRSFAHAMSKLCQAFFMVSVFCTSPLCILDYASRSQPNASALAPTGCVCA